MKILALNAYYDPEIAASLYLSTNLYEDLAQSGHNVEVYTPTPTRGIDKETRKLYKNKKKDIECDGNLIIYRFSMYGEGKNTFKRAVRYFLINLISLWKGVSCEADLIFAYSTPPTQGAVAALIKLIKNKPFVYSLQDVFPDSLVNAGMTKEGSLVWKIGRLIEKFIYKNADKIVVISEDLKNNLIRKGVPQEKIEIIYNWVDENAVVPINRSDNVLFDKYELDKSKFYVSYCGNLGYSQNLDMLLDVANELKDYEDIHFLLVGDGAYKSELETLIKKKKVSNITLLPFQPYYLISHVFGIGDVGLIISKANIGQNSVPSKTWSIMSAEKPIIASFDIDSELSQIIRMAKCGICVPADDPMTLKNAIINMFIQRDHLQETGKNGRKYILGNLTRAIGTSKYIELINRTARK
ncbi:MAG: glycosyltransferase family 4 protein [Ignavibacteria bacterium]|nr:glycosyltransferase family 4 protein [Ignavibacteria bacterium]